MKKIQSNWVKILFVGTILIIVYNFFATGNDTRYGFSRVIEAISPCIIGSILAFFLWRPSRAVEKILSKSKVKWIVKHKIGISVLLIYILIILIISLVFNFIIPKILQNVKELAINAPSYINKANEILSENKYLSEIDFIEKLSDKIGEFIGKNLNMTQINKYITMVSSFASSFLDFFLGIVFSVYILLEKNSIKNFAGKVHERIWSENTRNIVKVYFVKTVGLFYSYFSGLALDAVIIGIITSIVLSVFGVPYAFLLGVIVTVGNMIPFFGPIISAIVCYTISGVTMGYVNALWIVAFQLVLGQIDSNFIQPKILSNSTGLRPILVLFSVIVFGNLFGFIGMIVGVPLVAAVKMLLDDYFDNGKLDISNGL